jgi:hypothetical protein
VELSPEWVGVFMMVVGAFIIGLGVGARLEASIWRDKGDHEYMNRMESNGNLYQVRREK